MRYALLAAFVLIVAVAAGRIAYSENRGVAPTEVKAIQLRPAPERAKRMSPVKAKSQPAQPGERRTRSQSGSAGPASNGGSASPSSAGSTSAGRGGAAATASSPPPLPAGGEEDDDDEEEDDDDD